MQSANWLSANWYIRESSVWWCIMLLQQQQQRRTHVIPADASTTKWTGRLRREDICHRDDAVSPASRRRNKVTLYTHKLRACQMAAADKSVPSYSTVDNQLVNYRLLMTAAESSAMRHLASITWTSAASPWCPRRCTGWSFLGSLLDHLTSLAFNFDIIYRRAKLRRSRRCHCTLLMHHDFVPRRFKQTVRFTVLRDLRSVADDWRVSQFGLFRSRSNHMWVDAAVYRPIHVQYSNVHECNCIDCKVQLWLIYYWHKYRILNEPTQTSRITIRSGKQKTWQWDGAAQCSESRTACVCHRALIWYQRKGVGAPKWL